MAIAQDRSRRKASGGRYRTKILKRMYQLGRKPALTKLGEKKRNTVRTIGGNYKNKLLSAKTANIADKGKVKKAAIKSVLESSSNRNFVRANIMTKGTIIDTEMGRARVTSRPGQDGSVDAVLVK